MSLRDFTLTCMSFRFALWWNSSGWKARYRSPFLFELIGSIGFHRLEELETCVDILPVTPAPLHVHELSRATDILFSLNCVRMLVKAIA